MEYDMVYAICLFGCDLAQYFPGGAGLNGGGEKGRWKTTTNVECTPAL